MYVNTGDALNECEELIVTEIIQKKFKCKLCKRKYSITSDMLKTVYNITGFGYKQFFRSFTCPICGLIYINEEGKWLNETWEFFEA